MLFEFTPGTAMQSQLAHELLESSRAFGLPGNVFQDGRVGEHGSCQLLAVSSQHTGGGAPRVRLPTTMYLRPREVAMRPAPAGSSRSARCGSYCAPPSATTQLPVSPRPSYRPHVQSQSGAATPAEKTSPARQTPPAGHQGAFSGDPIRVHPPALAMPASSPTHVRDTPASPLGCGATRNPSSNSCGIRVARSSVGSLRRDVPPTPQKDLQ